MRWYEPPIERVVVLSFPTYGHLQMEVATATEHFQDLHQGEMKTKLKWAHYKSRLMQFAEHLKRGGEGIVQVDERREGGVDRYPHVDEWLGHKRIGHAPCLYLRSYKNC